MSEYAEAQKEPQNAVHLWDGLKPFAGLWFDQIIVAIETMAKFKVKELSESPDDVQAGLTGKVYFHSGDNGPSLVVENWNGEEKERQHFKDPDEMSRWIRENCKGD